MADLVFPRPASHATPQPTPVAPPPDDEIGRTTPPTLAPRHFHPFRVQDLPDVADLAFLVDGILPAGVVAEVHGAPGAGKSFVALAMALSIACDVPFLGRPVSRGPVLYIAGERFFGLRRRIEAWCTRHSVTNHDGLRVMRDAPQLIDSINVGAFRRALRQLSFAPTLIVIDTLSRCLTGADENGQRDMSKAIEAMDAVRDQTGATLLLIHHTRKAGDLERGSNLLRGAADVMMSVRTNKRHMLIRAEKVNDFASFPDIPVRLESVGDSCVLEAASPEDDGCSSGTVGSSLSGGQKVALRVLAEHANGLSVSVWARKSGRSASTVGRWAKDEFAPAGLVVLGPRGKSYRATDAGIAAAG